MNQKNYRKKIRDSKKTFKSLWKSLINLGIKSLKTKEDEIKKCEDKIKTKRKNIDDENEIIRGLKIEIIDLQNKVKRHEGFIQDLEDDIDKQEKRKEEIQGKWDSCENTYKNMNSSEKEHEKIEEEINDINARLKKATDTYNDFKNSKDKGKHEKDILEGEIKKLEDDIQAEIERIKNPEMQRPGICSIDIQIHETETTIVTESAREVNERNHDISENDAKKDDLMNNTTIKVPDSSENEQPKVNLKKSPKKSDDPMEELRKGMYTLYGPPAFFASRNINLPVQTNNNSSETNDNSKDPKYLSEDYFYGNSEDS